MSTSRDRQLSIATLEQIWDTAGRPPRAGLAVWRPYEALDLPRQEAMLEAAATAVHLARTGKITARSTLGPLLTSQPHQSVYEGDRPSPAEEARIIRCEALLSSWAQAQQEIVEWFRTARNDPATARQILGILTHYCRTQEAFDRERRFMIGLGISASFLPDRPTAGSEHCATTRTGVR